MPRLASKSDPLTPEERSERMSRVRGRGNRTTELAVATTLAEEGIRGWVQHPAALDGKPDFYHPSLRLALFVDGCFWHGCPECDRNLPRTRASFWRQKIDGNRARDRRITRRLRKAGQHVLRVWEHELPKRTWLHRFRRMLSHLGYDWRAAKRAAQSSENTAVE